MAACVGQRCGARRVGSPIADTKPKIFKAVQCNEICAIDDMLCKACLKREEKALAGENKGTFHGYMAGQIPPGSHVEGSEWALKQLAILAKKSGSKAAVAATNRAVVAEKKAVVAEKKAAVAVAAAVAAVAGGGAGAGAGGSNTVSTDRPHPRPAKKKLSSGTRRARQSARETKKAANMAKKNANAAALRERLATVAQARRTSTNRPASGRSVNAKNALKNASRRAANRASPISSSAFNRTKRKAVQKRILAGLATSSSSSSSSSSNSSNLSSSSNSSNSSNSIASRTPPLD